MSGLSPQSDALGDSGATKKRPTRVASSAEWPQTCSAHVSAVLRLRRVPLLVIYLISLSSPGLGISGFREIIRASEHRQDTRLGP